MVFGAARHPQLKSRMMKSMFIMLSQRDNDEMIKEEIPERNLMLHAPWGENDGYCVLGAEGIHFVRAYAHFHQNHF